MKYLVTGFVKITGAIPMWLLMKRKTYFYNKNKELRKIRGSAILIANHKSMWDFPLILCLFPFRRIGFLMAEHLFARNKLFSWFLKMLGGIKVNRVSKDISFVSEAVTVLNKGGIIGLFPEGKLSEDHKLTGFSPTPVYLALKSGAPIVPIYCNGVYDLFKRTRVIIGEKIYLKEYTKEGNPGLIEIKNLCVFLENEISKLKNEMEKQFEDN